MCTSEKYNCYICPATEMQDLLAEHKCNYKKVWSSACESFADRHKLETLSRADFFSIYKESCVLQSKVQKSKIDPSRQELCESCSAIHCDNCKKPGSYRSNIPCQTCGKFHKSFSNQGSAGTGHKCFLCKEFKTCIHITMEANESIWDPYNGCQKCVICRAQENGTERIVLQDLPVNGHPTEVTITRTLYARDNGEGKLNDCPRPLLPGIQRSLNARLTARLYAACVAAALKGHSFPEISEWYCISEPYLRKMKKEQSVRIEEKKSLSREDLILNKSRIDYKNVRIANHTYKMYFYIPAYSTSSEPGMLELAGIYSEQEQNYLNALMSYTILELHDMGSLRPDIPTSRVFAMAYDYANEQQGDILSPAIVFALVMAMADSFCCMPLAHIAYEYSALHHRMMELVRYGGAAKELLVLTKATYNYIPDSFGDSALVSYTDRLVRQLETMLFDDQDKMLDSLLEYPDFFDATERMQSLGIVDLISECMEDRLEASDNVSPLLDKAREDILFFNQVVVPYKYDWQKRRLLPLCDQYGDIDTSTIHSIGIRCSCLEYSLYQSRWRSTDFMLGACKDLLYDDCPDMNCPWQRSCCCQQPIIGL